MKLFKTGAQVAATLAFLVTSLPVITFTTEAEATVTCKAPATLVTRTVRGKSTTGCILPARTKLPLVCNGPKNGVVTKHIYTRSPNPSPGAQKVRVGGRYYYLTDTGKTVTACKVTPIKAVKKKCRIGFHIASGVCVSNKTGLPAPLPGSSSGPTV